MDVENDRGTSGGRLTVRHEAPDHLMVLAGHENYYPAQPAEPVGGQIMPDASGPIGAGAGVRVGVIDVGFIDLQGAPDRNLPHDYTLPGVAHPGATVINSGDVLTVDIAHGESVAWIVANEAPGAQVIGKSVQAIFDGGGDHGPPGHVHIADTELASAIADFLLEEDPVNIITITAGGPVGRGQTMPLTLAAIREAVSRGVLVVAAAGNDAAAHNVYPAAWPEVLAVGATTAYSDSACAVEAYNNRFPGIDVYGPGTHVVPFFTGTYDVAPIPGRPPGGFNGGQHEFTGFARVVGTSFAVPTIAGQLAAGWDALPWNLPPLNGLPGLLTPELRVSAAADFLKNQPAGRFL